MDIVDISGENAKLAIDPQLEYVEGDTAVLNLLCFNNKKIRDDTHQFPFCFPNRAFCVDIYQENLFAHNEVVELPLFDTANRGVENTRLFRQKFPNFNWVEFLNELEISFDEGEPFRLHISDGNNVASLPVPLQYLVLAELTHYYENMTAMTLINKDMKLMLMELLKPIFPWTAEYVDRCFTYQYYLHKYKRVRPLIKCKYCFWQGRYNKDIIYHACTYAHTKRIVNKVLLNMCVKLPEDLAFEIVYFMGIDY